MDANHIAILEPNTLFMSRSGNDEKLHLVEADRDDEDPFYIVIDGEDFSRYYWIGGDPLTGRNVEYSVFKTDVKHIH